MGNLYVEGPDALKLLSHLATNSFAKFPVDRAKQFAPCSYDGYVIGDGILFHLEENRVVYVGIPPAANWIQFHAQTGGYDVKTEMDERSALRSERQGGRAFLLPVRDSGTERAPDIGKAERRARAGDQVLQHGAYPDCRTPSSRPAPRNGRSPRPRSLGPLRGARRDSRSHCSRRQRFRTPRGRFACLSHQCHGVRLDSHRPFPPFTPARR